jgi:hypothetical protein
MMLVLSFSLITFEVSGQSNRMPNATFKIISQLDQSSGDTIKFDGVFIIKHNELSWGPDEQNLAVLNVESSEGSWNKKRGRGIVSCEVNIAEVMGTVKFLGDKSHLIIEIVLDLEPTPLKTKLFAKSISYKKLEQ